MRKITFIAAFICFLSMFTSCQNKNDYSEKNQYQWGAVLQASAEYSIPEEENLLMVEIKSKINAFNKQYEGSGKFDSDQEAVTASKYEEGYAAFKKLSSEINTLLEVFDNGEHHFKLTYVYGLYKSLSSGKKSVKDELSSTFEIKNVTTIRLAYKKTVEVPLTDYLQKADPASYSVVIPLEECGYDFSSITAFSYDGAKVYDSNTRILNSEEKFISSGSISVEKKELTLTFTGTKADLDKMKGSWYANVYGTLPSVLTGINMPTILKVPFVVK